MEANRWQKLEEIYHAALEKPVAAQQHFINEACGNDEMLRDEIVALISTHSRSSEFLNEPLTNIVLRVLSDEDSFSNQQLSPLIGKELGRFQIIRVLGMGGMGEVYLAKDTKLGRNVALKLLPEKVSDDALRVRRFKKEAHAASLISHINVTQVYEIGETEGRLFIAFEYVEGKTLRLHFEDTSGNWREVLNIAKQIAEALKAAHEKGVVHRDIKPENVMIRSEDGVIKVLDFGLAKLNEEISFLQKIQTNPAVQKTNFLSTEPGVLLGTADYMSPEQARGVETNARTDVWSFGILLYEMLTGKPPFKGNTAMDTLIKIVSEPFAPKETVDFPKALLSVIERCLCKNESERYKDGGELLSYLQNISEEKTDAFQPAKKRSHKNTFFLLFFFVLILTGSFSLYRWRSGSKNVAKIEPVTADNFIEKGGVSWWHGDGNASDSFGNNNGEMINGATFSKGLFGQAFSFDGDDDYFQSTAVNLPTGNSPRTMELWFKANKFEELHEEFFVGYGDFTDKRGQTCHLGIAAAKVLFFSSWEPGIGYETKFEANMWYHISGTLDENNIGKLYFNGKEVASQKMFVNTASDSKFLIGRIPGKFGDWRRLNGMIDEVRVYNRALSPEEILANASVKRE